MSRKNQEYLMEGSDYLRSYSKISGKKVKDIVGYCSNEFGDISFKLCRIIFEDGTEQGVEGEHDFPYLVDIPEQTGKLMDKIYREEREEDSVLV